MKGRKTTHIQARMIMDRDYLRQNCGGWKGWPGRSYLQTYTILIHLPGSIGAWAVTGHLAQTPLLVCRTKDGRFA